MWGEKWGEMIWGGNTGLQIPIGPWALVALGFVLGAYAVYTHRNRATHTVPFILILCVPAVAVIAASVPNVFENNTVAPMLIDQCIDHQSCIRGKAAFENNPCSIRR